MSNTIPMTPQHQKLILDGKKTTTLRGQQFSPGIYKMRSRHGETQGCLEVTVTGEILIRWTDLTSLQQQNLSVTEGYRNARDFISGVLNIAGGEAFIQGKRGMYLHSIRSSPCQT